MTCYDFKPYTINIHKAKNNCIKICFSEKKYISLHYSDMVVTDLVGGFSSSGFIIPTNLYQKTV